MVLLVMLGNRAKGWVTSSIKHSFSLLPSQPQHSSLQKHLIVKIVHVSTFFTRSRNHVSTNHHHHQPYQDDDDISSSNNMMMITPTLLSSSERYANMLNLTKGQVQMTKKVYMNASQQLHTKLTTMSSSLSGKEKHELICQHRYQYGQHPFVCHNCWSYLPICICRTKQQQQQQQNKKNQQHPLLQLPYPLKQIIIWTHHKEWGLTSNTGSLIKLLVNNTQLLMKGLPHHDTMLQQTLMSLEEKQNNTNNTTSSSSSSLVVVLWPDIDTTITTTIGTAKATTKASKSNKNHPQHYHRRMTLAQVQSLAKTTNATITLLVVEGTWRKARRMVSKLPSHVIQMTLEPDGSFWNPMTSSNQDSANDVQPKTQIQTPMIGSTSILTKLRRQGNTTHTNNLCTAEAITVALVGFGMKHDDASKIIQATQMKVDMTARYRGKVLSDGTPRK